MNSFGQQQLRAALAEAAATVHPSPDGLERIRARIEERRRPWWRRLLARIRSAAPGASGAAGPTA